MASERVASVAGNIVTCKRSRLAPDFVEKLTLGSMNWDFLADMEDLGERAFDHLPQAEEELVFDMDD